MQEKRIEVIIYYYGSKLVAAVRRGGGGWGDLREEVLVPRMPS